MGPLVLCAECNRHVRGAICPFCGARADDARSSSLARASRAAIFALAATPGLAACHREAVTMYGGPPPVVTTAGPDASAPEATSAATPSASASETAHVTVYGGPPTATVAPPVPK